MIKIRCQKGSKSILYIFLTAVLILSLVFMTSAPLALATTAPGTILIDRDNIQIIYTGLTVGNMATTLDILIENNSSDRIQIVAGTPQVNGIVAATGFMIETVSAGQSTAAFVTFQNSLLEQEGITIINEIRLSFGVSNADTMMHIFLSDTVTINPATGERPSPSPSPQPSPVAETIRLIENFGTWTGSGTRAARVSANSNDFQRLTLGGNVVSSNHYTVTTGSTVITLSAGYLSTLTDGTHNFRAEFSNGHADLALIVNRGFGAVPQTGLPDITGITIIMWVSLLLTMLSSVYLCLYIKKHKGLSKFSQGG